MELYNLAPYDYA